MEHLYSKAYSEAHKVRVIIAGAVTWTIGFLAYAVTVLTNPICLAAF